MTIVTIIGERKSGAGLDKGIIKKRISRRKEIYVHITHAYFQNREVSVLTRLLTRGATF